MEPNSAPPSGTSDPPPDLFRKAREKSLLLKWSKAGRLLQSEFEEIRHRLPSDVVERFERQFKNEGATGIVEDSGYARHEKRIEEYVAPLKTKLRRLKEYNKIGKKAGDLPPFDRPAQMAAWWARMRAAGHLKQQCPQRFLALASSLRAEASDEKGFEAESYSEHFAGALQEARLILAVATGKWKEACKSGVDARIEVELRRFLKALRAVKETEQAAREDKKASGELIPKAEIFPDLSELLQVLKHQRGNRRRRTMTALAHVDLTSEQREQIGAAVDAVREDEEKILRRLKHFHSLEEIDEFSLDAGDE